MFNFSFNRLTSGITVALGLAAVMSPALASVQGGTLVYLEQQAHTNLYPPSGGFYPNGGILNQITDKLTYQNPQTLEIEPWIAESWSSNADKTEYTFKLRPGVTFSDGTPLDANAVAKNFDTYGLGNKEKRLPVSEVINNYDHSEVIDPLTVKFYFKHSSPGFLQGTATIGSGLVSLGTLNRSYDELGDARHIIGSGPFVVSGETLGREVSLSVRKDYHWGPTKLAQQGRANLDVIKVIVTGEDSVRIGALQAGQADFIRQIQAYDEKQTQEQGFTIYAAPTRGVNDSVAFRPDNPLVSDLRVRQALLHATDSKQIVDTLFSVNYPQAKSVIASSAAGFVDLSAKLKFDPQLANRLLDEAGWKKGSDGLREKDGKKLLLNIYESLPQPQNKAVLQLVSQQWGKVGARLNILAGDAGSRVADNLDPQKTPAAVVEVGRADPDVIKSQFYPTNRDALLQQGGSGKNSHFSDDKLNALLLGIASEVDTQKRLQIAGEAQNYLLDQAYVIPFFEEPQVFAGAPYLKGVSFEAVGRPSFYGAWLEKH
ncbi:TIGR04028 family ABC transporter substrate-binding protein [Serratia quinivorans]|uniref:TIGR04028 family ABC transporter substrate-binding protein n=1 Tax=Serratia quinivorans TaxID=137545 RepID=UPI0021794E94|nr:TIGR04028 family ABC transporter substrate-binding protein [Serratia quinivorans]CAI0729768.1 Glutathione-binding protein gsiB precursor [Serratia quinivorans]CAI0734314.1 Glutathione-binding protein gsiB precursor [Serratia quinivorans]CAI0755265.1 Glutathione-binding protein gsiB precursor [Serratia quinivorans]CAI1664297.1 Glutathione-binding protein gsiB precursor [Serratia quinivorans]CAI2050208.1 Glutathione-binding protein gsiB precursor [Serratia quinivorans]